MTIKLLGCSGSLDGGGSERQLWQLLTNLPQPDFSSELFLVYRRGPYLDRLPKGIPVHAFSDVYRPNSRIRLPGSIHRDQVAFVKSLILQQKFQLVYDRTFHMTLITSKACKQANCPRVSVIVSPPSFDFAGSSERFKWLKFRILRRAYSDPNAITICVSQAVADDAANFYGLPKDCFQVVQSPVDVAGIRAASLEDIPLPSLGVSTGVETDHKELRIVVVGRMTSEKGHATVIKAAHHWKQLKGQPGWLPLRVDFIGDGPLSQELVNLAIQFEVSEEVRFQGFQANPYPWISKANVVCIPSLYEGLPNVALEAMALMRPVIATKCSDSLTSLVGANNERGQLVPVEDSGAIAQALMSIIVSRNQWEDRCNEAFRWISSHHSLDSWIKQMSHIFCELAGRKWLPKMRVSN